MANPKNIEEAIQKANPMLEGHGLGNFHGVDIIREVGKGLKSLNAGKKPWRFPDGSIWWFI